MKNVWRGRKFFPVIDSKQHNKKEKKSSQELVWKVGNEESEEHSLFDLNDGYSYHWLSCSRNISYGVFALLIVSKSQI
jgi:hypothetical protein